MKSAVDPHSGPFSTADATWPIQLSPTAIEVPLCWDVGPVPLPWGRTMEKLGRVPFLASVTKLPAGTMSDRWPVSRHSAKVGHTDHVYVRPLPGPPGVLTPLV